MFESDKDHEDSFYEGHHDSERATNTKAHPEIGDYSPLPYHQLPKAWDKMGPSNIPDHLQKGDYKKATKPIASATGLYLVYLTVDTEEHATRFVKDLFRLGLCAAVEA